MSNNPHVERRGEVETPRTDRNYVRGFEALMSHTKDEDEWVRADFARELERDLTAMTQRAEQAERERDDLVLRNGLVSLANGQLRFDLQAAEHTAAEAGRKALEEAANKIRRHCEAIAHECGYTEPDTGAYVANDDTTARLEAFDDAEAIVRALIPDQQHSGDTE